MPEDGRGAMTMLAHRKTWPIKLGKMDQAREVIQKADDAFLERGIPGRAYASYVSLAGPIRAVTGGRAPGIALRGS